MHPVPELPWSNISADLFDHNSKQYLVIVDSYSGWFEMDMLNTDSSSKTVIDKMKHHFATHGIPQKCMTDNGPQFISKEFKNFAKEWNFEHITSSPLYPKSNGLAENAVKQAKTLLEKSKKDGSDVYLGLLNLRNTPREELGSPAQRLLSRRTRTTLPTSTKLLKPKAFNTSSIKKSLVKKRMQQKRYHDKTAKPLRDLKRNEIVRVWSKDKFKKLAVVNKRVGGPRRYQISTSDGGVYTRNRRHLLPVKESFQANPSDLNINPMPYPRANSTFNPQTMVTPTLNLPSSNPLDLGTPQKGNGTVPTNQTVLMQPKTLFQPTTNRPETTASPPLSQAKQVPTPKQEQITTRYGRVVKPNPRYN